MNQAACHPHAAPPTTDAPVILVGNPNVGKSVIFAALTGRYVTVSNYPGTTVELTHGPLPDGTPIIDTPGTNSLSAASDDERVTAELIFKEIHRLRAVVQVADAKNLRRALLLTLQLVECAVPMVLVLNMSDEAETHGVHIDTTRLSDLLGIPVIPTIATQGKGLDELVRTIPQARVAHYPLRYEPQLETAIEQTRALLPPLTTHARGLAVRLLSGDVNLSAQFSLNGTLTAVQQQALNQYDRPLRTVIISQQIRAVQDILNQVLTISESRTNRFVRGLGQWMVHPIIGWPFLLTVLWLVYKFVGEFGAGTLVGFLENTVFGQWINPLATRIVDGLLPLPLIHDLLVGDYGAITMALTYGIAIVLPIVATFFLAFSILEDTGYLPRLAIMFNRVFKAMGLNGKAVLPMILGLGCDTMATMSTRILETRKERILVTLLLALGVPCSAQLGVILGMMGLVGTSGVVIWGAVVGGTMILVGLLAAKLLPGESSDFILEIPPLRKPRLDNILIKTLARVEWYLKEVLPLFIVGTLLLFVLDRTGALHIAEQVASPLVVGLLGLPTAATGAFLIGFLRRDYGAAGLFALALAGQLDGRQMIVSLIVITLFIPCIANVLMIVKEYGWRVTVSVLITVFPLAFAVGGIVNAVLHILT
jgi:ferrous iron transport protein B